jgi:ketosteroid isomerase-like protein
VRDTGRAVSEESTSPNLVELTRQSYEVVSLFPGDVEAQVRGSMGFSRPDSVWDMTPVGLGKYDGRAAIERFFEDWFGAYEELVVEPEEIRDLGNGVVFAVVRQNGRPVGSTGHVNVRFAAVFIWSEHLVERVTNYADIDDARAAAERLAEERA